MSDAFIATFIVQVNSFYYVGEVFFTEDTFIVVPSIAHL